MFYFQKKYDMFKEYENNKTNLFEEVSSLKKRVDVLESAVFDTAVEVEEDDGCAVKAEIAKEDMEAYVLLSKSMYDEFFLHWDKVKFGTIMHAKQDFFRVSLGRYQQKMYSSRHSNREECLHWFTSDGVECKGHLAPQVFLAHAIIPKGAKYVKSKHNEVLTDSILIYEIIIDEINREKL